MKKQKHNIHRSPSWLDTSIFLIAALFWFGFFSQRLYQFILNFEDLPPQKVNSFIFITVLTTIFIITLISNFRKRRNEQKFWEALAELHNAEIRVGKKNNVQIIGSINQRHLSIFKSYRGRKRNVLYTGFTLDCPNLPSNTLYLVKSSFFNVFLDRIDIREDKKVGESYFDKRYIIYTQNMDFLNAILSEEIKTALNMVYPQFKGELTIEKNKIRYQQRGAMNTHKRFRHFHHIINLAPLLADNVQEFQKGK